MARAIDNGRNSSIELLRLILMFMILVHHAIVHGLGLRDWDTGDISQILISGSTLTMATFINSLCICAVDCFVFISGYYGIKSVRSKSKTLIAILLFYTLFFNSVPDFVNGFIDGGLNSLMFLSHSRYWFVIDYLFLLLLAPLLNKYDGMDQRYRTILIVGLTVITVYFGFIWSHAANSNGYTLFQFIYLYLLGRFLRVQRLILN